MSPSDDPSGLGVLADAAALSLLRPRARADSFPPLYRALRALSRPLLQSWFRFEVAGAEHLPASGPFIVAANHHNYLDGIVLGVAVPRPIAFLVMPRVYRASPLHPAFHQGIGSIPIDVDRPDPGAIKRALRVLGAGRVVGIFPEGPFSREGHLVPGRPGAAAIALRAAVPVVPAGIRGTYEAMAGRPLHLPRRHPLSVRFGPPLDLCGGRRRGHTQADRQEATRRIMAEIAALLGDGPAGRRPGSRRPAAP